MEYQLADSRTGQPLKIRHASKKDQANHEASFLERFFRRLGWKPANGTKDQNTMKLVIITVPVIAGGKPRKKGEKVELSDLKAAELVAMNVAKIDSDITSVKPYPWERKAATEDKPAPAGK